MQEFLNNLTSGIGFTDVIDIFLVAFVVYKVLGFIRESRAEQLVRGLLILLVATFLSGILHLYTLNWILKGTLALGAIALVIVFQPELRRGLEQMGRGKLMNGRLKHINKSEVKDITGAFVEAIENMSTKRVGALIVIERDTSLIDICETGTRIDAEISAELIGNIFYEGAPLHDGALIVREGRLHSAGCVLPLTENMQLPTELGTRHRAGIGITERSDALALIVSEETGIISIARNGKLQRYLDSKAVEKAILDVFLGTDGSTVIPKMKKAFEKSEGDDDDAEK